MEIPRKWVFVVAGVLVDTRGNVLLAQRASGAMAGLWEFPGGKLEQGETPKGALARELKEELGIVVDECALKPLMFVDHAYPNFDLFMPIYSVPTWQGEPAALVHTALVWAEVSALADFAMPAADVPIVARLMEIS